MKGSITNKGTLGYGDLELIATKQYYYAHIEVWKNPHSGSLSISLAGPPTYDKRIYLGPGMLKSMLQWLDSKGVKPY